MLMHNVEVRGIERVEGTSDSGKYAFTRVHVLDDIEMFQCRLGDHWPVDQPLVKGLVFSAEVVVNPYVSRKGPQLGVTLVRPVDVVTDSGQRRAASADGA